MNVTRRFILGMLGSVLLPLAARGQIDPDHRELVEFGINQAVQGAAPISAYAYYYHNQPGFLDDSNLTLRLAVAPVYLDSEVGFSHLLGANTDLGVGLAGGGFADNFYELRQGKFYRDESFDGDGATPSVSVYHLFNPGDLIPLNGLLRGEFHYADYIRDDTDTHFVLPPDQESFNVRTGFRFGGQEPVLMPELAAELSLWYQGDFRLEHGRYGFNGDRVMQAASHLFWTRALIAYTFKSRQSFQVAITAGESLRADRFSAYRLGGFLPLAAEFPLTLPGYFSQELSATRFALLNASYSVPLDPDNRFSVTLMGSAADMSYLPGLEQAGSWNSGVGGGVGYHSASGVWRLLVDCGYGINAIRDGRRGAESVGMLMQINLGKTSETLFDPTEHTGIFEGMGNMLQSVF